MVSKKMGGKMGELGRFLGLNSQFVDIGPHDRSRRNRAAATTSRSLVATLSTAAVPPAIIFVPAGSVAVVSIAVVSLFEVGGSLITIQRPPFHGTLILTDLQITLVSLRERESGIFLPTSVTATLPRPAEPIGIFESGSMEE